MWSIATPYTRGYCIYPQRYSSTEVGETCTYVQSASLKVHVAVPRISFANSPITINLGVFMHEKDREICIMCSLAQLYLSYLLNYSDDQEINNDLLTAITQVNNLRRDYLFLEK